MNCTDYPQKVGHHFKQMQQNGGGGKVKEEKVKLQPILFAVVYFPKYHSVFKRFPLLYFPPGHTIKLMHSLFRWKHTRLHVSHSWTTESYHGPCLTFFFFFPLNFTAH